MNLPYASSGHNNRGESVCLVWSDFCWRICMVRSSKAHTKQSQCSLWDRLKIYAGIMKYCIVMIFSIQFQSLRAQFFFLSISLSRSPLSSPEGVFNCSQFSKRCVVARLEQAILIHSSCMVRYGKQIKDCFFVFWLVWLSWHIHNNAAPYPTAEILTYRRSKFSCLTFVVSFLSSHLHRLKWNVKMLGIFFASHR